MTVPVLTWFRPPRTRDGGVSTHAGEGGLALLDRKPPARERALEGGSKPAFGQVELEDVSFRHPGRAHAALKGFSLRVAPGETLLVEGLSGAGRSTLARLLVRLCDPDAGVVRLDGVDLRDLELATVRANVGSLCPEQPLSDTTLWENITRGCPRATREEVVAAASATGADELAVVLRDGSEASVGPAGSALSREQRQRVRLARALLCDTPVVVLDDPFSGLDEPEARGLLPALAALCRGRTTILLSDHPLARELATRTVPASGGRIPRPEPLAPAV